MATERKKKIAGRYLRVSSTEQAKRKSYQSQDSNTANFIAGRKDLKPGLVYTDKGISGRSVDKRTDFQRCMADAASGKFEVLVVDSLSRFGRNAREILNNVEYLQQYGVQLISIKESFELSTPFGKAMVTILSALAELESDMIGERSTDGRITKAKQGVPTGGKLPFGREFDKKTGEWKLDERKVDRIRWAAAEILNGRGTIEVSNILKQKHGLPLSRNYLRKVLTERCGDTYTINFRKGEEPVTFAIPRILDDATIADLKDRFKINKQFNRTNVKNKNLLNQFTRCAKCDRAIKGWTDKKTYKGRIRKYPKYCHPTGSYIDCDCRFNFNKSELEKRQAKLNTLPNIQKLKSQGNNVRTQLLKFYKSSERLNDMSYDEKWALLNYFFSGKDENGKRFGIYVDKDDRGDVTFFIYGAYMLYKPKQWKKGLQIGTKFKRLKYLDGTDALHDGRLIHRRIFADNTLSLGRGQTCCRKFINRHV